MAAPLLQAQIDIDAPVSRVWKLISDVEQMPRWSPQCRWTKRLGPLRPGTHAVNLNRRGRLLWPTTSKITALVPEKEMAFRVGANGTEWRYRLEATDRGTRVIETRHAENGVKAASNAVVNALFGGVPSFEQELVDGMNQSLARIKAAAEA